MGEDVDDSGEEEEGGKKKGGKGKLLIILLAVLLLLGGGGAAAYFLGYLDPVVAMITGEDPAAAGEGEDVEPELPPLDPLDIVFLETPEILVNLRSDGSRRNYVKMRLNFELADPADNDLVQQAMPRILDALGIYLRELRPESFAGSEGAYQLRQELLIRADAAARPARINDVLIKELLVQ